MGEPWLDSLSEDWNSEPRLSSPAPSSTNSRHASRSSRTSSSRIPHLAHSMRRESSGSSFLRPRSSRGRAKSQSVPVLSERSASSLNLPGSTGAEGSIKRLPSVTLPRRTSSNFSDSQQSVQHHTVHTGSNDTPEWKKRLHNGEDIASDGFDLFSPSKLEGMFAQPVQSTNEEEKPLSFVVQDTRPWSSLSYSKSQPSAGTFQSFRTSRSRAPLMEALPELNEDEDEVENGIEDDLDNSMSAISSELARSGSMRGLVKRRVTDLEQPRRGSGSRRGENRSESIASTDPRWRTTSGQQELRDEYISPVTVSTKNTISAKALRNSVELNPDLLKQRLMDASSQHQKRPSSRSSDRDISYNGQGTKDANFSHEEAIQDMTSHSLPEDLSMGTQDFASHGGFINTRRGAASHDTSFFKKNLSLLDESSQMQERNTNPNKFRSSPPPYDTTKHAIVDTNDEEMSEDLEDGSVLHHEKSPQRPLSAGSPLKLFGNRDTYTNNKLLRVLSQFEQNGSDQSLLSDAIPLIIEEDLHSEPGLRMSQFGKGELDTFDFRKEVLPPSLVEPIDHLVGQKIFPDLADLTIDDEGTFDDVQSSTSIVHDQEEEPNSKRVPSSPAKERTPKRRRTLLHDEIQVSGIEIEVKVDQLQDTASLAGKKRKDARPGEGGTQADPKVLASRSILRPRSGSGKSSGRNHRSASQDSTIKRNQPPIEITEALAAELASFAHEATQAHQDSRKPSLATKDYMEEANKVMEFIRARGKPKSALPEIQEPADFSELEADKILDLEIEDESTIEPFSRPPSREGPIKPREDPRVAKHDSQMASHLRKFKDSDDLDLVATTSLMGTLHLIDNKAVTEAAQIPLPAASQRSSVPNLGSLSDGGEDEFLGIEKHSTPADEEAINTVQSSDFSTRHTFASDSSNHSGKKGVIIAGKVSIPDNVGTMTFDREKRVWVKQQLIEMQSQRKHSRQVITGKYDEVTFEDDPFGDIPDLTVDEQHEAAMRVTTKPSSRPSSASTVQRISPSNLEIERDHPQNIPELEATDSGAKQFSVDNQTAPYNNNSDEINEDSLTQPLSLHSELSNHEERLHEGLLSVPPPVATSVAMQPRVVTIAFSSPVASEIPRPVVDISEPPSDDEDYLPPDYSDDEDQCLETPKRIVSVAASNPPQDISSGTTNAKHQQYRSMSHGRRPVSRIEEVDEDPAQDDGMSLVHIQAAQLETPAHTSHVGSKKPTPAYRGTSILCLTPLSEFTMHQADRANHPEESFVQERAHPKALLQAHGALALSVDTLIKAITDAVSGEPFWEQLRRLELRDNRLQTVYGLKDYCSALEVLDVSGNQIAQLDGLPETLRNLDISSNKVNDFTSWGHLPNLQYVDVSGNNLENLEGFSSLVHIRRLKACGNKIRDIEGVLDLDGLISLDLSDNQLTELDFEGVDMPRLEELTLRNNKLTAIHNLQYLPRLKHLDLSGNAIGELHVPEALPNLKTLMMSKNELASIDLAMFPALTELDLDSNCIQTIESLATAVSLRRLSLRDQHRSNSIFDFVLTTPNECNEIFLSSNTIPQGKIQLPRYPHYNLRKLEMAACGLHSLPASFGDYFPNCRSLNLNFNAISELSPLLGCIKLRKLALAGNRIKRLRRTCLTVSRMPALESIDIRNNPLTVGFYAPDQGEQVGDKSLVLPKRSPALDVRWLQILDETTGLKRKMVELLLMEGCPTLQELDGAPFNKEQTNEHDAKWNALTSKGVLIRAIELPGKEHPGAETAADNGTVTDERCLEGTANKSIHLQGMAKERSLTVE